MDDFKIGARVACYVTHGSYSKYWESPETIVRETKSCWVTDKGSKFYKSNHHVYGTLNESFHDQVYHIWTDEMEIKRQRTLLRKSLEEKISAALTEHKFTVQQLQYIQHMLEGEDL